MLVAATLGAALRGCPAPSVGMRLPRLPLMPSPRGSKRLFHVQWQRFSFVPIAIAVYATAATLHALAIANPLVVQDEYMYFLSGLNFNNLDLVYTNAQEMPRLTNYLYFALIKIVSRIGVEPDTIIKVVQIVLVCMSAWLASLLTKNRLENGVSHSFDSLPALLLSFLLLWPSNTLSVFVMPDILYFDVFLLGFSLILSKINSWEWQVTAFACTAGLLFHVKPHALFLFVGLLCAIVVMKLICRSTISIMSLWRCSLLACASIVVIVELTRSFFALMVKLPKSDLIGNFYSGYLSDSLIVLYRTMPNLTPHLVNYMLGSLMVVGPCLTYILWILLRTVRFRREHDLPAHLAFPGLLCVICWVVLVIGITIATWDQTTRIYLRYLEFTFPAFVVSALVLFTWARNKVKEGAAEWAETPILSWAMALTWSIPAIYFAWRFDDLTLLFTDAPDLFSMYSVHDFGVRPVFGSKMPWVSASVILVASGLIILRPQIWIKIYLSSSIILFLFATLNLALVQRYFSETHQEFRRLGDFTSFLCPNAEQITLLANRERLDSRILMYHTAFAIKGPAHFVILDNPSAEELQKFASQSKCIVAPTDMLPKVKLRDLSVQGLELQW